MSNKHWVKGMKRRARKQTGRGRFATIGDLYKVAEQAMKTQRAQKRAEISAAYAQRAARERQESPDRELARLVQADAARKQRALRRGK